MKLFHWTAEKNLLGIATGGLEPFAYDDVAGMVSAGHKVVWLTASETRTPTATDLEWINAHPDVFRAPERERFSKLAFGKSDDVRLTVKFNSSNNRKLKRARPWLEQFSMVDTVTGEATSMNQIFGPISMPVREDYYVHLGVISARQIELPPLTARIALLGLNDDAPQVEQLRSLPPDTVITVTRRREAA